MVNIENGDHYATAYSIKAWELYLNFFKNHKLRVKPSDLDYTHNAYNLLGQIFTTFMQIVIKDIIENRTTFKLPAPGAWIEMVPISDEKFKIARQNGAFDDVDFLMSNFTGYQLYLRMNNRYGSRKKQIHVTKKYKDRITELTNQGVGW